MGPACVPVAVVEVEDVGAILVAAGRVLLTWQVEAAGALYECVGN